MRYLDESCKERIVKRRVLYEKELETIIFLGKRSGVFRVANSVFACQAIFSLMDGFAERSHFQKCPAEGISHQAIKNMIDLLLGRLS
ncbi:hypothetical protein D3C81_1871040 [compost metagenome]